MAATSAFWPLATGVLTAVFTVLLLLQYLKRRKPHQLWWTVGFAMYSAAAFMEYAALRTGGWDAALFRLYVVTTAILVPVLAMGTVALTWRSRLLANGYLGYNIVIAVALVYGVLTTTLITEELARADVATYAALGGTAMTYPRVLSLFMTIPATFVLLGGAVQSIVLFARKREFAYRMWANVLIALATIVIAGAGSLAKAGNLSQFYLAELVAAALYLAGFLMAGTLEKGSQAAVERRHRERDAAAGEAAE